MEKGEGRGEPGRGGGHLSPAPAWHGSPWSGGGVEGARASLVWRKGQWVEVDMMVEVETVKTVT